MFLWINRCDRVRRQQFTMERLRISLSLAAVWLLLHKGATAEMSVTCGAHVHRLECESGVLSVDTAFYGRADRTTCAGNKTAEEVSNTDCSHGDALAVLRKRCNGKRWCEINSPVIKEDPCNGIFKYMRTTYSCVPATHRRVCQHSIAHLHCSDGKVIRVLGADYGRRDSITCSFKQQSDLLDNTDCYNPTVALGQKCNGLSSCDFTAYLEPGRYCSEFAPYLEYSYVCEDAHK